MQYELRAKPHWSSGAQADGLKSYDVLVNGQVIGEVEGYHPTIEKDIPGKRYVAWRRKSRTVHWCYDYPQSVGHRKFRTYQRTRKDAIERVISEYTNRLNENGWPVKIVLKKGDK